MGEFVVGDRVFAVLNARDGVVNLFGYGRYEGDSVPEQDAAVPGSIAEVLRQGAVPNPTILLDSGERVYGCECWWGPAARFGELREEREVKAVSITAVRREMRERLDESEEAVP